jgi:transcriptional regulator with GAF, ATPase, and Fis domain
MGEKRNLVRGFEVGGVDYISKPFQSEEVLLRLQTHLEINRLNRLLTEKNRELEEANHALQQRNRDLTEAIARQKQAEEAQARSEDRLVLLSEQVEDWWGTARMCGESGTLKKILAEVAQLQSTYKTSVLIVGESGTGKELVARAIHFGGMRAKGPFVPVNCAAIPAELAEASFFGHVRGAFTGAERDRKGFFEQADGGTLFLDEVGEMPLALQAKLLRVLEDGMVQPVGGDKMTRVDVRVLAATNADLQQNIAAGTFRRDVYYRLGVVLVRVPPLRDRKDDLILLADHFLGLFAREMGIPIPNLSQEALLALQVYDFPGNVRELKNMIEYALIKNGGTTVLPEHLPDTDPGVVSTPALIEPVFPGHRRNIEEEKVLMYLQSYDSIGNIECCDLLGVSRRHATHLLKKMREAGKLEQTGSRRWVRYRRV